MKRISRRAVVGTLVAAGLLAGCTSSPTSQGATTGSGAPVGGGPEVTVSVLADGLDIPWDVAQAPDGTVVFDERGGKLSTYRDGKVSAVQADFDDVFAEGEAGLMGLVLDPQFADNRRFYTCQAIQSPQEIRVVSWTMADDWSSAKRVQDPLVGGLPRADGGRHSGCRLRFDASGALQIGTGDTANGLLPQDRTSLGGKTLRVDPQTGGPMPDNPFVDSSNADERLVYTWGHRNVQGLALRPGTDDMYSVEQGSTVDDEVNLIEAGANYGWNPTTDGTSAYDESVPMTDEKISGAVPAVWSSGDSTIATSGGTFLSGKGWGDYDGLMALGVLKGTGIELLKIATDGTLESARRWAPFEGTYGRVRTVQMGTDGSLYVTTSNGGTDQLLRVTPKG